MFPHIFTVVLLFWNEVQCDKATTRKEIIEIFSAHREWEGHYTYNKTYFYSMLIVHSYDKQTNTVIATFKDVLGATIDVRGKQSSDYELTVLFTVEKMFKDVQRFPSNFSFIGTLIEERDHWFFRGSVVEPANGTFGEIQYQPTDSDIGPFFDDKSSLAWRYTLIIGVPILLGLIGVAGTVGIIYWAIKKGYIRHVPKNYNYFNNPVQYDNSKQAVHM